MSDSDAPEPAPTASVRPSSRPPSARDSSAHVQAALTASGRAEASLSMLMRAIRELSSGVSGAREANVQLLRELEAMADLLGAANERQLALKNRVSLLEQTLERVHIEAQRERAYILDQQDAFIAAMMDDHEQVIAELNRELEALRHRASQRPTALPADPDEETPAGESAVEQELGAAKKTIEKLVAERERTREALLKVQAQRDEAQAALVELGRDPALHAPPAPNGDSSRTAASKHPPNARHATTLPPPEEARVVAPAASAKTTPLASAPVSVGSLRPKAPALDFVPRVLSERPSQPPEELRGAVHPPSSGGFGRGPSERSFTPPGPPSVAPATAPTSTAPANPSGRPGGYSLTNSVAPEHVSGAPRISRLPRG